MWTRLALTATLLAACSRPEPRALPAVSPTAVVERVEQYVAQGKTPTAFTALAVELTDVGVGEPASAEVAELRLVGLATPLVAELRARPVTEQVDALALTVWPALLAEPLTSLERSAAWTPRAGESTDDYVSRLCEGPLTRECGDVAAEQRALVVRSIVMRRADERMQRALASCLDCAGDPAWQRLGWTWESLDRDAARDVAEVHHRGARGPVVAVQ